jgi:putative membrane protein
MAFLVVTFLLVLVWSAIGPKDRGVWWLEVSPAIVGAVVLLATWGRFPLTPLLYVLIWAHALVLFVAVTTPTPRFRSSTGFATASVCPQSLRSAGTPMQGFVPAMIAREILRAQHFCGRKCCSSLRLHRARDLGVLRDTEWWVAIASDTGAQAFLGTQGTSGTRNGTCSRLWRHASQLTLDGCRTASCAPGDSEIGCAERR